MVCHGKILNSERIFLIEKTGFGKSLCFQFPTTVFSGNTAVFSPLVALMSDQVRRLRLLGISSQLLRKTEGEATLLIENKMVNYRFW